MGVSGESLVYTPSGTKKLASLKQGEPVYSFDDYTLAERACLGVSAPCLKTVSRITLEDGRSLLATDDQMMVKVVDPKRNLKWAMRWFVWEPLSEFKPGDMVIAAKTCFQEEPPKAGDEDEEFARHIGYRDSSLADYAVNPFFDPTYTELLNIRSIEKAGDVEVCDIMVEHDESFVAEGFVLL